MTCIVGTREGLWSDRKISCSSGQACDPLRKLAVGEGYIAGFAGAYEGILAALQAVREGAHLDELAKVCKTVEGLALCRGKLYVIESGQALRRTQSVYAVGSGGATALAFLAGRGRHRPIDIRAAHRHVARVRDDCGRGVTYLRPV